MLDHHLRSPFQSLFIDPFLRRLQGRVTPTQLTFVAMSLGVIALPFIALQLKVIGTLLILASGYTDIVDGSLARHASLQSDRGAVLDIFADRVVECAIIFGLYLVEPTARATLTILMLISILLCVTSFLVVGIVSENESEKSFHYSPGLMERAEAFAFFIAMLCLPQYYTVLAISFVLLVLYTALKRLHDFHTFPQ